MVINTGLPLDPGWSCECPVFHYKVHSFAAVAQKPLVIQMVTHQFFQLDKLLLTELDMEDYTSFLIQELPFGMQ